MNDDTSPIGAPDEDRTEQFSVGMGAKASNRPSANPGPAPLPPPPANLQQPSSGFNPLLLIDRLILRGTRGELIEAPWFQDIRQRNADPIVIGTYVAGFVISVLLDLLAPSELAEIFVYALWIGTAYLYLALGTKLAHQFLKYGICLVALAIALLQIWEAAFAIFVGGTLSSFVGVHSTMALLYFRVFLGVLTAPVFAFVGLRVHRFSSARPGPQGRQPVPPINHFGQQPRQGPAPLLPHPQSPAPPVGPYAPYPGYVAPRQTNSMAIAALVASLTLAPLGIIFGHISLSQIKRSGEDGRGLAIAGLVIGYVATAVAAIGLAILVAGVVAFNSALDSIDSEWSTTTTTTYETTVGTPSATSRAIKNAEVGDCIHRVSGARNSDGTRDTTVSPATCGTSYATHEVTMRTDDTSDCYDDWVRTSVYSPPIVLCLAEE